MMSKSENDEVGSPDVWNQILALNIDPIAILKMIKTPQMVQSECLWPGNAIF